MSFRTTVHESLPYIDAEPTPEERSAAEALITAELSSSTSSSSSPNDAPTTSTALPPLREPRFSALIEAELTRVAAKEPLQAIDTSRYEQSSDPIPPSLPPSEIQARLERAQTASTYLTQRHAHLSLLDAHGRNAWLVGNWQAEAETAAVERELADARRALDRVNLRRRTAQQGVAAEVHGLNDAWRRGVGRVLEAEAAAEELRRRIREETRKLAAS